MEFSELIRSRYSVRRYSSRDVPREVLDRLVEAFVLAPTAANRQPLGLVVIETGGRQADLRRIYNSEWFAEQPPYVLAVCVDRERAWMRRHDGKSYADVDAAIAMDHLVLAAANEGLGTCWIGAFDPGAAREVLALPEGVECIALTPLGYAADSAGEKRRKPAEQLVHWNQW